MPFALRELGIALRLRVVLGLRWRVALQAVNNAVDAIPDIAFSEVDHQAELEP
jgi:hypothetical protein